MVDLLEICSAGEDIITSALRTAHTSTQTKMELFHTQNVKGKPVLTCTALKLTVDCHYISTNFYIPIANITVVHVRILIFSCVSTPTREICVLIGQALSLCTDPGANCCIYKVVIL